ncbi:hypothetical protein CLM85_15855 [Streptomyces albidoflavus]|uniref:hypothetical protein n=1 Tax=Streptomyces albidoflavus TaxID=1886 RepID=UPI000BADE5FE|nr:hypothetical protein [Streptomyces albidoflavus]PAX83401.1 hypothetical protein CLM81_22525 [Streptomyces albidoflavus]PBO16215.1 hypothetical protein CLM83_25110 [Streptomyces albidoflavus]PBO23446.1 hypothetical protein CLM85_15855 [Streptomyces albidoflavus]PBO28915.1 hypothetical protein CLM84_17015 [Streptomyces albidoflavus]
MTATTAAFGTYVIVDPDTARRLPLDAPDRYLALAREVRDTAHTQRAPQDAEHTVLLMHGHACALADHMQIHSATLPADQLEAVNRALTGADAVLRQRPDASPAGLEAAAQTVIDLYAAGQGWLEHTP